MFLNISVFIDLLVLKLKCVISVSLELMMMIDSPAWNSWNGLSDYSVIAITLGTV